MTNRAHLRVVPPDAGPVPCMPDPLLYDNRSDFFDAFWAAGGDHAHVDRLDWEWERHERARRRLRRLRKNAPPGLMAPGDAEAIALRKYERSAAVRLVMEWSQKAAADPRAPRILVMLGPPDAGKTFAALCWMAETCGRYVKERELCRLSRASWGEEATTYAALLREERLVIDEVDPNRIDRELALRVMMDVVDDRKGGDSRTIIIANATRAEFVAHRADPKLESRLKAYARVEVVIDDPRRPDRGELL
ncbi:MAG: ATP-binding protein [Myxococcales bacterium]|nr:ATP-binding protein [Myxococcales bacterium]